MIPFLKQTALLRHYSGQSPGQEDDGKTKGHRACAVAHVLVAAPDAVLMLFVSKATGDAICRSFVATAIDQGFLVGSVGYSAIIADSVAFAEKNTGTLGVDRDPNVARVDWVPGFTVRIGRALEAVHYGTAGTKQ